MPRALTCNGQAIQLARQTDRKIADINHLLHFAQPLGADLAHFKRYQLTQCLFVGTQHFTKQTHQFTTLRCRDGAPAPERGVGALGDLTDVPRLSGIGVCKQGSVNGRIT